MGATVQHLVSWRKQEQVKIDKMATEEQTWKSLVYNTNITPDQVHTFYKTWAETYEDDMIKLNFTSAGRSLWYWNRWCCPCQARIPICGRARLQQRDAGPRPGEDAHEQAGLQRDDRERLWDGGSQPAAWTHL